MADSDSIETLDLTSDTPPLSPRITTVRRKTETKISDLFSVSKKSQSAKRKRQADEESDAGYETDTARSVTTKKVQQDTPLGHASIKLTIASDTQEDTAVSTQTVQQAAISSTQLSQQPQESGPTPSLPKNGINIHRLPPASTLETSATRTKRSLQDTAELHSRYVPQYLDPVSGVAVRDPKRFCVKPAYWRRWPQSRYHDLVEDLRQQWDPVPFATRHNLPVEEVRKVFTSFVCDPLYDAPEEARKLTEGRMEALFELHKKYGTEARDWTNIEGKQIHAEFTGVRKGNVELLMRGGTVKNIAFGRLSADDQDYVLQMISEEEMKLLEGGKRDP